MTTRLLLSFLSPTKLDCLQFVDTLEGLQAYVLYQVLRILWRQRQAPCRSVKRVKVRLYQCRETASL